MKPGVMKGQAKKKQIVQEERERQWYIPPCPGIPVYKADSDPNCPAARVRRFNEEQRSKVQRDVQGSAKSEQWVKSALDRQYTNIPLKKMHDFRAKATEYTSAASGMVAQGNVSDIAILQQIIVRENLLNELYKLCRSNNELLPILNEVVELIKAVRFETLDVIESIADWQTQQPVPRPFLFKGINYLIKMRSDMDFLDQYDEVVERFCFEFRSNPLAYRGGGTVVTGFDHALSSSQAAMQAGAKQHFDRLVQAYQTSFNEGKGGEHMQVDGITLVRLHNAEKVIQAEFNRIMVSASAASGASLTEQTMSHFQDARQLRASWETAASFDPLLAAAQSTESLPGLPSTADSEEASPPPKAAAKKARKKSLFNPKKAKLERITVLEDEASELEAMVSHIRDKLAMLAQEVKQFAQKASYLQQRQREARENGKEGAAMHIAAEAALAQTYMQEKRSKIKDLHREAYFIQLERKRKLGVIRQMQDEMMLQREREKLKRKIEAKIKKDGLIAALKEFDGEKLTVESLKLGGGGGRRASEGSVATLGSRASVPARAGSMGAGSGAGAGASGQAEHERQMADLQAYNAMIDAHEHIEDMDLYIAAAETSDAEQHHGDMGLEEGEGGAGEEEEDEEDGVPQPGAFAEHPYGGGGEDRGWGAQADEESEARTYTVAGAETGAGGWEGEAAYPPYAHDPHGELFVHGEAGQGFVSDDAADASQDEIYLPAGTDALEESAESHGLEYSDDHVGHAAGSPYSQHRAVEEEKELPVNEPAPVGGVGRGYSQQESPSAQSMALEVMKEAPPSIVPQPPSPDLHADEGSVASTESKKAARGTGFSFARFMRGG